MTWNWEKAGWPHFTYRTKELETLEARFLRSSGVLSGAQLHVSADDKTALKVSLISEEALKTSEIEGEYLNRDSVQSSIRRQFGLHADKRKVSPAEQGISELMVNVYEEWAHPLSHETLWRWHRMLMRGHRGLVDIGRYRTHEEPMQVISGALHDPTIHFEAPPSKRVPRDMTQFIEWFNDTGPLGRHPLPALTRSGIAHLYFVCVHPFEDGNGRIGRAICEKALAQHLGQPTLIALSRTMEANKKAYYAALAATNRGLEISDWLVYFSGTVLDAQQRTLQQVEFTIAKAKLYARLVGQLNLRQEKALARMFAEGVDGFKGGLSADNYIRITKTSRATATRDLQDLVELGALRRIGELKHTRYDLNLGLASNG